MCLSQCEEQISRSLAVAQALADDVDVHVVVFRDFGKEKVKKCRVSPDAFIQIALQLAYYRVSLPPEENVLCIRCMYLRVCLFRLCILHGTFQPNETTFNWASVN